MIDKVCFYNLNKNKILMFEGNKLKGNIDSYFINVWFVGFWLGCVMRNLWYIMGEG